MAAARQLLWRLRAVLQGQFIGDQGDELPIGWFFIGLGYITSKCLIQRFDAAAAPGYLDGMTDGALHFAGAGAKATGNGRIELLGDAADHGGGFDDQLDGLPKELIALDMGWDTHGEEKIRGL